MPVFIQDHPPKPLPVSGTSYLYSATSGLRNPSLPVCECSPSHQGSPQQLPQGCVPGHVPGIPEPAWQQLLPVPSPALGSNCPVNGFPIFFQDRGKLWQRSKQSCPCVLSIALCGSLGPQEGPQCLSTMQGAGLISGSTMWSQELGAGEALHPGLRQHLHEAQLHRHVHGWVLAKEQVPRPLWLCLCLYLPITAIRCSPAAFPST